MLNETNPTFTYWLDDLDLNTSLSVCSSINDLEVFVGVGNTEIPLRYFAIYDSGDLKHYLGT